VRPAVRIIFAPIMSRSRKDRERGLFVHGTAQNRTITIDPRSSEIGKTLLHEMLHVRHPDWSEEAIVSETRLRWGKMSWKEKARLLRLLGSARLEGEDEG
jgi:hypothetical protein